MLLTDLFVSTLCSNPPPPSRRDVPRQPTTISNQYPPETESWSRGDTTLWVGIASFRDSRCGATLFNLFSKADFPDRVTAGVVQQNLEGDQECLPSYCRLMDEKVHAPVFTRAVAVVAVVLFAPVSLCWLSCFLLVYCCCFCFVLTYKKVSISLLPSTLILGVLRTCVHDDPRHLVCTFSTTNSRER